MRFCMYSIRVSIASEKTDAACSPADSSIGTDDFRKMSTMLTTMPDTDFCRVPSCDAMPLTHAAEKSAPYSYAYFAFCCFVCLVFPLLSINGFTGIDEPPAPLPAPVPPPLLLPDGFVLDPPLPLSDSSFFALLAQLFTAL